MAKCYTIVYDSLMNFKRHWKLNENKKMLCGMGAIRVEIFFTAQKRCLFHCQS